MPCDISSCSFLTVTVYCMMPSCIQQEGRQHPGWPQPWPSWNPFMLEQVVLWDFMGTNLETFGLRAEWEPAERLSWWGKNKSTREREPAFERGRISLYLCWKNFSIICYSPEGKHENAEGRGAQPFLWVAWVTVVRRIKARYHVPLLKADRLE